MVSKWGRVEENSFDNSDMGTTEEEVTRIQILKTVIRYRIG